MATTSTVKKLFEFIAPKKKQKAGGTALTDTFDSANVTEPLTLPEYQQHLTDVADLRLTENSQDMIKQLMLSDPDVSAATSAYLNLSNTKCTYIVRDSAGEISRDGQKLLKSILYRVFEITDYTLGYQSKPSFSQFLEELRYMLLMRGAIGVELVYDKTLQPSELRNIDMDTIEFKETANGVFKPIQTTESVTDLDLDIPTFFTARFKQDPTDIYSYSYFSSSINTIVSRATVINDLYRIMKLTGYPRVTLEVVEEVLKKRAPKDVAADGAKLNTWMNERIAEISNSFENVRADSPFAYTDSVKVGILNDRNPGMGLQVADIINTLNAQNQAGLKVVSTILGRGESGVNTASVEARIFSLSADALNTPISSLLSRVFTLALRLAGFDGFVEFSFKFAELKPDLELESVRIQKQTRLLKDLSLGFITDEQYAMEMYGDIPPEGMELLSGTRFLDESSDENVDTTIREENSIDRATTPDGANSANSNEVEQV